MIPTTNIRKILISRLRFMGDIILTTPLVRTLGEAFPHAQIYYLAEQPYVSLLENHPYMKQTIPFDFPKIKNLRGINLVREQFKFISELKKVQFDLAIDLFGNPRSAIQTWLSGARYRIGGDFKGRGKLYNFRIDYQNLNLNAIGFHLKTLEPLGIAPPTNPRTEIYVTPDEEAGACDYLLKIGIDPAKPIIGIHTGATWPAKMWLMERFVALIREIKANFNVEIILTQGPGEEARVRAIQKEADRKIHVANLLTLRQLAALLKQFTIYISNDCGPMHLSVAVGTRTLGIFGPGEPEIWFPYSAEDGHRFIHKADDCWPCHQDFCDSMACMKNIQVNDVLRLVTEMMTK